MFHILSVMPYDPDASGTYTQIRLTTAWLVADDKELQRTAFLAGSSICLTNTLTELVPLGGDWNSDEPESTSILIEVCRSFTSVQQQSLINAVIGGFDSHCIPLPATR